eukprot:9164271-Ditylum_brightwellii.AAC.1
MTAALRFTNNEPPPFKDPFFNVRQMIDACNNHMHREYTAAWLNCLDKLMNPFLDKNCPGFMSVP